MQPHLTKAYQNAARYTRTVDQLESRERMLETVGAGWVELRADLTVKSLPPSTSGILEGFFPTHHGFDERLPTAVEDWVRAASEAEDGSAGAAPFVIGGASGRLTLRLLSSSRTGELSIVVERFLANTSPEPLESLGLTKRQAETLYWLIQGKSNAEIAVILRISRRTVDNHIYRIFEALGVNNRTAAAARAAERLDRRG